MVDHIKERDQNLGSSSIPNMTGEARTSSGDFNGQFTEKGEEGSGYVDAMETSSLWRKVVLNFMPSWFAATMGTGVVSCLLFSIPYNGMWLYWISVSVFLLNVILWCTFLIVTILRPILYPWTWSRHLRDGKQAVFLAACPTGFSTIINMVVYVCVPAWGGHTIKIAWALWWLDVAASMAASLYLPFAMMTTQKTSLSQVNASWLLPMVSAIVASATGSLLAGSLQNPDHALWTILTCYVILGASLTMALMVTVLYMARLILHGPPSEDIVMSGLITLGPLGSGSFAFLRLGKVARTVFNQTRTLFMGSNVKAGEIFFVIGWVVALLLMGFSLVWLFVALGCIVMRRPAFNLSWWALTFPLGVVTSAVLQIGREARSGFFEYLGTVLTILVTALWLAVSSLTIRRLWIHGIFLDSSLVNSSIPDESQSQISPRKGEV